jgi:hypothetical protein
LELKNTDLQISAHMKDRRRPSSQPSNEADSFLEMIAWLMDSSIPIGRRWSIGLDGLLGLIPGFGDLTGGLISSLIIARSLQAGLPRSAILRMILNVAVDSILGSLPFVGDLFDFVYKANSRNVEIYREAMLGERRAGRDWAFVVIVVAATIILVTLPLVLVYYVVQWLL